MLTLLHQTFITGRDISVLPIELIGLPDLVHSLVLVASPTHYDQDDDENEERCSNNGTLTRREGLIRWWG